MEKKFIEEIKKALQSSRRVELTFNKSDIKEKSLLQAMHQTGSILLHNRDEEEDVYIFLITLTEKFNLEWLMNNIQIHPFLNKIEAVN